MHRTLSLSLAIAACLASTAWAVPQIVVGPGGVATPYVVNTNSLNIIQILVSSPNDDDFVPGVDFVAEVQGGVNAPSIAAVDIVNGTFFGNNRQPAAGNFGPALPSKKVGFNQTTLVGTELAEGVMVTLTIDTTGIFSEGLYPLNLTNVAGLGSTNFLVDQFDEPIIPLIQNGFVLVTPEPGTIVLGLFAAAGLGAVALRKRRLRSAA